MKKLFASVLVASFFVSLVTFAAVDPSIHWKTMHLPHFDLIYDAKHQALAEIYAVRLEDNIQTLTNYFSQIPEKTVVVLNDQTDLTNGYATPIPYQLIMVYPVLPGPSETISEYGDWARELTMHEYTHILSFEPKRGVVKALHYVFGTVITPNLLLPRWWLEGIAVDMETRNSSFGRSRSNFQDGAIRAYVINDTLQNINLAEINETSIHTWPQGMRPYLFGSLMWNFMISKSNKNIIQDLTLRYGGRMPFFIEAPVTDLLGENYQGLFDEMKLDIEARARAQIAILKSVPGGSRTPVLLSGEENLSPAISPDGKKMIYIAKDDANKRSIKVLIRPNLETPFDKSQETETIKQKLNEQLGEMNPRPTKDDSPPGGTIQRLAWFPDSMKFVFDKLYEVNRFHEVSDLYLYDFSTEKTKQLTFGLRAREAAVSPDGTKIAFVNLDAGTTRLGIYDMQSQKVEIVFDPGYQKRVSFPVFSSNDEVIFSLRDNQDQLWQIDLKTKKQNRLFSGYKDVKFANFEKNGLTFVSNKNGVNNLYLSSNLKDARPLTNSLTAIFASTWDPILKDYYITEFSDRGEQIYRTQDADLPGELPSIQPLLADRLPKAISPSALAMQTPDPENYSALPYLVPRYWFPSLAVNREGTYFAFSTSASDPLAKHTYSLAAGYSSATHKGNYSFLYENNSFQPILTVQAFELTSALAYTSLEYKNRDYDLQALWQIPNISTDLYAGGGWDWLSRDYTSSDADSTGPYALMQFFNATQSGAQISPESGFGITFKVNDFIKQSGRENFYRYNLVLQKYFSKWLPKHHVLYANIHAQYIDENVSLANKEFTLNYNLLPNLPNQFFVLRGFSNAQFIGKSLATYTLEYRFPIAYPYRGNGTTPVFIKKLHGAVVADGLQIDGYSFNIEKNNYEPVPKWKSLWAAGLELKADLTLGYQFPLTMYAGFYSPLQKEFRNDPGQFIIGVQL